MTNGSCAARERRLARDAEALHAAGRADVLRQLEIAVGDEPLEPFVTTLLADAVPLLEVGAERDLAVAIAVIVAVSLAGAVPIVIDVADR